jgi:hypothetical protein
LDKYVRFGKPVEFVGTEPEQLGRYVKGIGAIASYPLDNALAQPLTQPKRLGFGPPIHPDHSRPDRLTGTIQGE